MVWRESIFWPIAEDKLLIPTTVMESVPLQAPVTGPHIRDHIPIDCTYLAPAPIALKPISASEKTD